MGIFRRAVVALLPPLIPSLIKRLRGRGEQPDPLRRERARLRSLPRYQRTATTLLGEPPIEILDSESFLMMYEEIVKEDIYSFPAARPNPFIIDGGANVGVSVLRFKELYPAARVLAFEPDEAAFALLERNVASRSLTDVTLVLGALAGVEARRAFIAEGSYAGRLSRPGETSGQNVPTVRLRPYLDTTVDLLKLNIEGAETEVLEDCADLLDRVERIVLEYHSFAGEPQSLARLLGVLSNAGFRLYVRSIHRYWPLRPFFEIPVHLRMDLQLYVYAFRDGVRA